MENFTKIFEVLSKALEERDVEISVLKYQLEQADKRSKELQAINEAQVEVMKVLEAEIQMLKDTLGDDE